MAKKPTPTSKMDRKQPRHKERSNDADRSSSGGERRARDRRTGEGSQSALANLKNIERDRQRTTPTDDEGGSGS